MPNYIITITDSETEKVRNEVERNLQEQKKQLDAVKDSDKMKYVNKLADKLGLHITYWLKWKWEKNTLHLELDSSAPLKNKIFNDAVRKLAEHGKMRIERIRGKDDEEYGKGNVILNEGL